MIVLIEDFHCLLNARANEREKEMEDKRLVNKTKRAIKVETCNLNFLKKKFFFFCK
jgi:hypothetical protein